MAVISKMTFDNGSTKNLIGSTFYGKCTTAAGTAAKTVTIGGWTESTIDNVSGTTVHIYFENGNTAVASGTTYVTLSIDGSNPHKIITDADVNVGAFPAGVYEFTFVPVTVSGYTEYRWLMGAKALSAITADSADSVPWGGVTGKPSLDFIPTSQKGANSGVATLDANGKVPSSQLPSYVDDVINGFYHNSKFYEDDEYTHEIAGETGKIYIDVSSNKTYRWSGNGYTEISASLALGETSSAAYRGDRGATAYSHATDSSRLTTAQSSGLYKFATTAEGHIASVTAVQKSDITGLGIPAQDTTYTFDGTYNASTNKAATVKTVTDAIGALDGSITGSATASKTLTAFSQTDGKVTATFGDISITKSQVSDFSHTHGYISNDGKLLPNISTAIASGDRLVITSGQSHDTITSSALTFGNATNTFLRNNGTWGAPERETFTLFTERVTDNPYNYYVYNIINCTGPELISFYNKVVEGSMVLNIRLEMEDNYYITCPLSTTYDDADDYPVLTGEVYFDHWLANFNDNARHCARIYIPISIDYPEGQDLGFSLENMYINVGVPFLPYAQYPTSEYRYFEDGLFALRLLYTADSPTVEWEKVPMPDYPPSNYGDYVLSVDNNFSLSWKNASTLPVNSHTHTISQITDATDLQAIEALTGTSGLLKKTAANTWTLDTTTYLASSAISDWAKASTKPSYALSELAGASDVQAIEVLTGTSGFLKKTAANTWSLDTTSYLPTTGGNVTGDITLLKQVSSGAPGDSYSIIFQRGVLTDNYNDWKITDSGGYLHFYERGSGSTSWNDRVYFNTTGGVVASGQVQANSVASTSFVSAGSYVSIGSTCDVATGDALVVGDASDSNRVKRSNVTFGTSTDTFLRNDGTWATPSGGGGGGGSDVPNKPGNDGHYMLQIASGTATWENAPDLWAIEGLSGTTGLLKKTAANTWTLDTTSYLASSAISDWAKAATKPSYALSELTNADDVQAIEALSTTGLLRRLGNGQWETDSTTYLPSSQKGAASGVAELDTNSKVPVTQTHYLFGKCSTASSTAEKAVSITGFATSVSNIESMVGITVFVVFAQINTASSATLNINSTAAYPIVAGSYQDPVTVNRFSNGVHAFTLIKQTGEYYWFINEGRDTIPEAPSTAGTYIINVDSFGSATWTSKTIPTAPTTGSLTLASSGWAETSGVFSKTVTISGSTANSKIDLQPNATVINQMVEDGITALYIENNNGTLTAYAIGAAPSSQIAVQYTRTEVA